MPAVAALDHLVAQAQATFPGYWVCQCEAFRVFKGIVLEGFQGSGDDFEVQFQVMEEGENKLRLQGRILGEGGRPHYGAELVLVPNLSPRPFRKASENQLSGLKPYPYTRNQFYPKVLFHGPEFHFIEEVTGISSQGMRARLRKTSVGNRSEGWATDLAIHEGGLQMAALLGRETLGKSVLPTRIEQIIINAPVPKDTLIYAQLQCRSRESHGALCDIIFLTEAGEEVAEIRGLETTPLNWDYSMASSIVQSLGLPRDHLEKPVPAQGFYEFVAKGLDWEKHHPERILPLDWRKMLASSLGNIGYVWGQKRVEEIHGRILPTFPNPPFLLMDRCTELLEGVREQKRIGQRITVEYDVHPEDWFFLSGGNCTMPFSILLEVALQAFSLNMVTALMDWYSAQPRTKDLFVRNLDGRCLLLKEVKPALQTLSSRSEIVKISQMGETLILTFQHSVSSEGKKVFEIETVTGAFPLEALRRQVGLRVEEIERKLLQSLPEISKPMEDYRNEVQGLAQLADTRLMMLDAVTGYDPQGGLYEQGVIRGSKEVKPEEWFFDAHFYGDPVMPGSLGLESMLQLMQVAMIEEGWIERLGPCRFEPVLVGQEFQYKYRGQVLRSNKQIQVLLQIKEKNLSVSAGFAEVKADGALWVDGTCIYKVWDMGMRARAEQPFGSGAKLLKRPELDRVPELSGWLGQEKDSSVDQFLYEKVWDPQVDTWLQDHCPAFVFPTMPLAGMVQILQEAAQQLMPQLKLVGIKNVQLKGWLSFAEGKQTVRTEARVVPHGDDALVRVRLLRYRQAAVEKLSRFEEFCSGEVIMAEAFPGKSPPEAYSRPSNMGERISGSDLYQTAYLFGGPEFQVVDQLEIASAKYREAILKVRTGCEYDDFLTFTKLLDGAAQSVGHFEAHQISDRVKPGQVGFPYSMRECTFYGELPRHPRVRVEIRFHRFLDTDRMPEYEIRIFDGTDRDAPLWARILWSEILVNMRLDKIGGRSTAALKRFMTEHEKLPEYTLSEPEAAGGRRCRGAVVRQMEAVPHLLAHIFLEDPEEWNRYKKMNRGESLAWLTCQILGKELAATMLDVHPAKVVLHETELGRYRVFCREVPLTKMEIKLCSEGQDVIAKVLGEPRINSMPIKEFWRPFFGKGHPTLGAMGIGMVEKFLRHIRLNDPEDFYRIKTPRIYLANHQTFIESFVFNGALATLEGRPITFLVKQAHEKNLLGRLEHFCSSFPGAHMPQPSLYVNREDKKDILRGMQELKTVLTEKGRSVLIHVEGRRSYQAADHITKLSSIWADLALQTQLPIIPVRFLGGLPEESHGCKYDFPLGYGTQDVYLGSSISPEKLAAMPLLQRTKLILEKINELGSDRESLPNPGDPAYQREIQAWMEFTGTNEAGAGVYLAVKRFLGRPEIAKVEKQRQVSGLLPALIYAGELAQSKRIPVVLVVPETPQGRWLEEFARWVFGNLGPEVAFAGQASKNGKCQVIAV